MWSAGHADDQAAYAAEWRTSSSGANKPARLLIRAVVMNSAKGRPLAWATSERAALMAALGPFGQVPKNRLFCLKPATELVLSLALREKDLRDA
jgi:hypothetical protein